MVSNIPLEMSYPRLLRLMAVGMGNRFRELPQYHTLIRGHGIVAAITFLLIVPSAILTVRFYGRNPRWAVRLHIWLQILTVLLTTVIFTLGWFAVGPERSLTNPHHGIGLAIYIMVLLQAIDGWWVHKREKAHRSLYRPVKVMVNHAFSDQHVFGVDTCLDPSLVWSDDRTLGACSDSSWTYPLWIPKISIHTICTSCVRSICNLLHPTT